MSATRPELSVRYYAAEAAVWVLGIFLVVARFFRSTSQQAIPLLQFTPDNPVDTPRLAAVLLLASLLYLWLEWVLSPSRAKESRPSRPRALLTLLWAIASLWIACPIVARSSAYEGISPAWAIAYLALGYALGAICDILVLSALMIRPKAEADRLALPRVPAAARAQFKVWPLAVLAILAAHFLLFHFSPQPVAALSAVFTSTPIVLVLGSKLAWLHWYHDENGNRVPYNDRLAGLRKAFAFHDREYQMIDRAQQAAEFFRELPTSPRPLQRAMKKELSSPPPPATATNFRVQQLEKATYIFGAKNGNKDDVSSQNIDAHIRKDEGDSRTLLVRFVPVDPPAPSRDIRIQTDRIEAFMREYAATHTKPDDLTPQKIVSYGLNQAVVEDLMQQAGPALYQAANAGWNDHVEQLLRHNADPNVQVHGGWTPLLAATANAHLSTMRLLLDAGADPEIANVKGITPLHYSARYGNDASCRLLLKYGARLNTQDMLGQTALAVAAAFGNMSVVELLLNAGASVDTRDIKGRTPLDAAEATHNGKIAALIRRAKNKIAPPP